MGSPPHEVFTIMNVCLIETVPQYLVQVEWYLQQDLCDSGTYSKAYGINGEASCAASPGQVRSCVCIKASSGWLLEAPYSIQAQKAMPQISCFCRIDEDPVC